MIAKNGKFLRENFWKKSEEDKQYRKETPEKKMKEKR